jgi:murein DD-endopeptidase MepM/ murein hydrolase activator NlpD
LACAAVLCVHLGAGAQQVGRAPMEVRVPSAPAQLVALGRTHLAYEVHLTNVGRAPVALDRLDVLDERATVLDSWSAVPLRQRTTVVGLPPTDAAAPLTLDSGRRAVIYVWLTLAPDRAVPAFIAHRLTVTPAIGDPVAVATERVRVQTAPAHPLRPPVGGGPWIAVRGPSPASGHRLSLVALEGRLRVPQRFAVDWVKLGTDGRAFGGSGGAVTDWHSYDAPVLAVADGVVALVRDGLTDTPPRTSPPAVVEAADAPGNVVVLALDGGRFAVYAHLKAGSMLVRQGDRVAAGQPLARIGNSGNALGPHLHFHLSDAIEPLGGEGLAFSIDRFDLVGRVPSLGSLLAGTPWTAQASQPARTVTEETPLENMVLAF